MKTAFTENVIQSIPDLRLYVTVGAKDINRALEMIAHSSLSRNQKRVLSEHLRKLQEHNFQGPKNY